VECRPSRGSTGRLGDTGGSRGESLHTTGDPACCAAASSLGEPTVPVVAVPQVAID
jgi:hypothetical protein